MSLPKTLEHPSFGPCELVHSIIAIRWKTRMSKYAILEKLRAHSLMLASEAPEFGEPAPGGEPGPVRVNQSETLTWATAKKIHEDTLERLRADGDVLWVAPVFCAVRAQPGPQSFFATNPTVLLVTEQAAAGLGDLSELGESVSIDEARTKALRGFVVLSFPRQNALEVGEKLLRKLGPGSCRFENFPYISPTMSSGHGGHGEHGGHCGRCGQGDHCGHCGCCGRGDHGGQCDRCRHGDHCRCCGCCGRGEHGGDCGCCCGRGEHCGGCGCCRGRGDHDGKTIERSESTTECSVDLRPPSKCCVSPCEPPWCCCPVCVVCCETKCLCVPFKECECLGTIVKGVIEICIKFEHKLCLCGKQQGPLLFTQTLLPKEKVTLFHHERYHRATSEAERFSAQTTFLQFLSAVHQAKTAGSLELLGDQLATVRGSTSARVGGGLAGLLGLPSRGVSAESRVTDHRQLQVGTASEEFHRSALQSAQLTGAERSIVITSHEDKETANAVARTLCNENDCRAVTYFVRQVMELWSLTTRVCEITFRICAPCFSPEWRSIEDIGSLPKPIQDECEHVLKHLPKHGECTKHPKCISLPTDGAVYDPELACCSSCEPERLVALELQLEKQKAEARQACLEAQALELELERRRLLLERGELTPFGG